MIEKKVSRLKPSKLQLFFLSKGLISILLPIKYEQQKKLYSLPTTISHEAGGMSRPEVEVQKNYTDLLDRQKQITKDNHSSANKKKSNTRHNLFCTTCLENKIFFPYLCIRIYFKS